MKALIALLFLMSALLVPDASFAADKPIDANIAAIKKTLLTVQCPPHDEPNCTSKNRLIIRVVKIYRGYAHAKVKRADALSEINDVYLKKEKDRWVVLAATGDAELKEQGVPEKLWVTP